VSAVGALPFDPRELATGEAQSPHDPQEMEIATTTRLPGLVRRQPFSRQRRSRSTRRPTAGTVQFIPIVHR
jgi:hypothetical protein